MAEGFAPIEIFCCYAREDETWLRKLDTHLGLLKRQGLISLWYDRFLSPGTNWAQEIDVHLETASVILLLVSADFFASDYCYGIEMQRALEREAAGEARVIPILARPADWKGAPFAHLQVLPTDAKPIVSWPNKDTALADVAAGIRRVIVEELPQLTASAPRAALPKIWNVPYPRNPFFLGRDAELLQVRHNLHSSQATALSQPQAISGLGGIGKTQLALEYAYLYHQDYTAVLWARAESIEALASSYLALATLLSLPEREAKEQEVTVQAVKTWLQVHRGWLLILDNADELTLLPDFLPSVLGGHLLLTTRAAATGRLAHRLEIEALLPEQGAVFLLRRAGFIEPFAALSHASQEEREQAFQISQELGGLPLALDQAGAYLEETGVDLSSYQQIYQQHRTTLLRERRGLVADHPLPVATTWSISFQRVEERNPAAADLLRMLAFLSPDAIPEEILTAGASQLGPVLAPVAADTFLLNQAIETLRAYSLLQRNSKEKTFSVHRLVQTVLQDTLEEMERRSWAELVILVVNATFPHAEYGTWMMCERLLPQALLAAQWSSVYQINQIEVGRLLHETASYLQDRARYHEAEPLYQRALRIREQQLGSEHRLVAVALNNLAILYSQQSKYAEAEPLYQRTLHILERQLGSEHPDMAGSLNNLANLYFEQSKYAEAEPLYQRTLHIWEQQLGSEHPDVAYSLNNLANLYFEQGKYAEAEPLYQRALRILEQQLGPEHPDVTYPLGGLANLYFEQGKYAEAEPLYQRALRIREQQLGPEHPQVAILLNNLACLYLEQGKYAETEPLYQRALRIREQESGSEHLHVAYPLNGLANLYFEQGKYAEAEPLYQRALRIREQQLGLEHPETAETIHDLARFWETQGNREKARSLYTHALAIRERALGTHHSKTTQTRTRLIALLHALGQHEEAAQLEATQSEL
jgi:tetratricopeptide (TPR) repeat protein